MIRLVLFTGNKSNNYRTSRLTRDIPTDRISVQFSHSNNEGRKSRVSILVGRGSKKNIRLAHKEVRGDLVGVSKAKEDKTPLFFRLQSFCIDRRLGNNGPAISIPLQSSFRIHFNRKIALQPVDSFSFCQREKVLFIAILVIRNNNLMEGRKRNRMTLFVYENGYGKTRGDLKKPPKHRPRDNLRNMHKVEHGEGLRQGEYGTKWDAVNNAPQDGYVFGLNCRYSFRFSFIFCNRKKI